MESLLIEPFRADFMQTAALTAAVVGVLCGVVGCYVVLRGLALTADSLAHGVLPGVALAFVLTAGGGDSDPDQLAITGGALVAGLVTAGATGWILRRTPLRAETAAAVVFVFMLALGVALISQVEGYAVDLNSFLFGDVLAVTGTDLAITAALSAIVLVGVACLYRPFLLFSFDPRRAAALGLPTVWLDLAMLAMITLAVVIGFRVVGALLVLGMLIAPPAAAALATKRLPAMMGLSAGIAAGSAPLGLLLSWHLDIAAGASIVLVSVLAFVAISVATYGGRRGAGPAAAALASVVALVLAASALGDDSDFGDGRPRIAATTGILADIATEVAGDDAEVVQVIPDAASPHDFQLSAGDRRTIEDSLLLVHNGASLEQGIPVDEFEVAEFALADHVGELRPFGEEGDAHEKEAGHEEGSGDDPHVWMDPTRVAAALPALAETMAEADPEHAKDYRTRADDYAAELTDLDRAIAGALAAIPAPDRELVTSHDALGYFADRYGLAVVATPFAASGPEAEAGASTVAEVVAAIRAAGVPTIFAQADDDPRLMERIADQAGVAVEDGLLVEAPGTAGSYTEMLETDAELIARGLGAGDPSL